MYMSHFEPLLTLLPASSFHSIINRIHRGRSSGQRYITPHRKELLHDGVLSYLANCSELRLFCIMFLARLTVMALMVLSGTLIPRMSGLPSVTFDTGFKLFSDTRLYSLAVWDGVHYFHIAKHGYSHENNVVFFPFIPMLIRFVTWFTTSVCPLLLWIAPVAFYVSLINMIASSVAGVLLRRITVTTLSTVNVFDGATTFPPMQSPHHRGSECIQHNGTLLDQITCLMEDNIAVSSYTNERVRRSGQTLRGDKMQSMTHGRNSVSMHADGVHVDAKSYPCQISLDGVAARFGANGDHVEYDNTFDNDIGVVAEQQTCRVNAYGNIVGGTMLAWIISPTHVFSVAVYTESAFALFALLGIYLLIESGNDYIVRFLAEDKSHSTTAVNAKSIASWSSKQPREADVSSTPCVCINDGQRTCQRNVASMSADAENCEAMHEQPKQRSESKAAGAMTSWDRVPLVNWQELAATLSFTIACSVRSNAFLCGGFLIYPIFTSLCFSSQVAQWFGNSASISTLPRRPYISRRRLLARIAIVLCECITISLPFIVMNYYCWSMFSSVLPLDNSDVVHSLIHNQSGNVAPTQPTPKQGFLSFLTCYRLAQKKFWYVGFLSSYNKDNWPNFIIAVPSIFTCTVLATKYYIKPAIRRGLQMKELSCCRVVKGVCPRVRSGDNVRRDSKNTTNYYHRNTYGGVPMKNRLLFNFPQNRHKQLYAVAECLLASCNVVYFIGLSAFALTVMHVQVSNRFLAACPAFYWLCGCEFALCPRGTTTKIMIVCAFLWNCVGIALFSNIMPWT